MKKQFFLIFFLFLLLSNGYVRFLGYIMERKQMLCKIIFLCLVLLWKMQKKKIKKNKCN